MLGQWDESWQAYARIIDGTLRCGDEPFRSVSLALEVLLRLGQRDKAIALQKQFARRLPQQEDPAHPAAMHASFLAIIGETAKAKRILERFLSATLASVSDLDRLIMYSAAILLVDRLAEKGPAVKIELPAPLPPADAKGRREIAPLRAWFWHAAERIARQFDARNQNDGRQRELHAPAGTAGVGQDDVGNDLRGVPWLRQITAF